MVKVQLHQNNKAPSGFIATFPYSKQAVEQFRQCLGFSWDSKAKVWRSEGPEVLLDMQRFGVGVEWISAQARVVAEEFRQTLWQLSDLRSQPFDSALFGYQRQGSEFLAAQRAAILGDDMGVGKTKQALDAISMLSEAPERILVVCPKTVVYNWQAEAAKWHPEIDVGIVPEGRERRQFWEQPHQLTITNYEKLILKDWPQDVEWDVVVFDEATRLKNSTTQTYKAARKQAKFASHAWALTGTPLEIKVEELYSIFSLLRPAVFGNWPRFKLQHLVTDWAGSVVGTKNLDLLRERIGPWMLRRTKAEVLPHLPPKVYTNNYIKMGVAEQKSYQTLLADFDDWLKERGVQGDNSGLVRTVRARQFCCSPAIFGEAAGSKYDALVDLLTEWLRENDSFRRAVVFCGFEDMQQLLRKWLHSDFRTRFHPDAWLSGDTPAKERLRRIDCFNNGQLGHVFLSTDAGNQGINLTGADMIVHYDQLWNPQKMHQREDRLHRIGQQTSVQVVNMLLLDTIDVGMYNLNREREQLFEDVVEGSEEAYLRKLSSARLRKILRGQS